MLRLAKDDAICTSVYVLADIELKDACHIMVSLADCAEDLWVVSGRHSY